MFFQRHTKNIFMTTTHKVYNAMPQIPTAASKWRLDSDAAARFVTLQSVSVAASGWRRRAVAALSACAPFPAPALRPRAPIARPPTPSAEAEPPQAGAAPPPRRAPVFHPRTTQRYVPAFGAHAPGAPTSQSDTSPSDARRQKSPPKIPAKLAGFGDICQSELPVDFQTRNLRFCSLAPRGRETLKRGHDVMLFIRFWKCFVRIVRMLCNGFVYGVCFYYRRTWSGSSIEEIRDAVSKRDAFRCRFVVRNGGVYVFCESL